MSKNLYDYESAKKIIYDESNVTHKNPLVDLGEMLLKLTVAVILVYFIVFLLSGFLLKMMSSEKQIQLENLLSSFIPVKYQIEENNYDNWRINNIRNNIKYQDGNSLKTYNRNISIIDMKQKNAFCLPNGNIYISKPLYDDLKDDEMLTFVVAHEIAHYKNKDHLMALRKSFASMTVLIILAAANPNNQEIVKFVSTGFNLERLNHSRKTELNADKFAIQTLDNLYGNHKAGIRVLELLKNQEISDIEILSDHPNLNSRIKFIKQYK